MDRIIRPVITIHDEREAVRHARGHVTVIDDDDSVRIAVASILHEAGYAVEQFASATAFLEAESMSTPVFPGPRCLLIDVKMPDLSGLELQSVLADLEAPPSLLFMSGGSSAAEAVQGLKAGALDFLCKPFTSTQLLTAVECGFAKILTDEKTQKQKEEISCRVASLTGREAEIGQRVSQGLMNQQIAAELGICERTVKLHRTNMMRKLGAANIVELVRLLDRIK